MYYFIINPNSKTGKGRKIWEELRPELDKSQITYKAFFTKRVGHGKELAFKITSEQEHCRLVVLGGDGTINEVVNGICEHTNVTLGYIPTGSSNDLARSLRLAAVPKDALASILTPVSYTETDIGTTEMDGEKRDFIVSTGIGFDASICLEALNSNLKKWLNHFRLGKLTYAVIAVKQLFRYRPSEMTVYLDHVNKITYKKVYFIAVMNQPYEGGGLKMTPAAKGSDGMLDVCIVEGYPRLAVLLLLPTAFFGLHTKLKRVHIRRCREISVISERKAAVHTDGESCGYHTLLKASCSNKKMRIINT